MYLKTNNHTFYVKYEKYNNDVHFYSIGNANNNPKACVTISVMPVKGHVLMALQDIEYFSTCSAESLEKKMGTVEMLQGSIRAILKRHPNVARIELQDKSFFTLPNNDNIPLPEYRLLTKGKTWYEEYFGALPRDVPTKDLVDMYKHAWASNKGKMPSPLTEETFKEYLKSFHFHGLISGNAWRIPLSKVKTFFQYDGEFKKGGLGGTATILPEASYFKYIFRLYTQKTYGFPNLSLSENLRFALR
jgi:hypothetical protein